MTYLHVLPKRVAKLPHLAMFDTFGTMAPEQPIMVSDTAIRLAQE